jgi:hypothetical protein
LLGAGNTHLQGQYREAVASGLQFLIKRQGSNGDLTDPQGNMYSHGLATLALCEALAMTRDAYLHAPSASYAEADSGANDRSALGKVRGFGAYRGPLSGDLADLAELAREAPPSPTALAIAAQRAVGFVAQAQHAGGGWRYRPNQPGDTSVVGWQLMALKSGHLAGLDVDAEVIQKTVRFLDSVSEDFIGSCYGYTSGRRARYIETKQPIRATTPIGLLCRMYTGWDRRKPGLVHGVKRLSHWAQPGQGLYYYYYATQVLHHYGGAEWETWDHFMRNYLVHEQSRSGSEEGSWHLQGSFDDAGRLYCTALAVMTLEVYYRYAPIYGEKVVAP